MGANPVITTIATLSHEGRGVSKIEGKTTFIDNALPDEIVDINYIRRHKSFDEAIAGNIENPHPQRVTVKCQHYNWCGGCNLQHLSHDAQLQHKQQVLLEQLQHFGHIQPDEVIAPISAEPWGYRYKARLGVRYMKSKQQVIVGFRERNSRFLANLQQCEILLPAIGKKLPLLNQLIASLSCPADIPQIELAASNDTIALVIRHMCPLTDNDLVAIKTLAKQQQWHIYLQPKGIDSIHKIYPNDSNDYLSYTLAAHNIELLFHPADFTQINPAINTLMVDKALELLEPQSTDNILDLFCGLGNFTLALARHSQSVTGVEGSQAMVKRGYMNSQHNQIENTAFYEADLSKANYAADWAKQHYDKILIDPPRSGAETIVNNIEIFNAKRIVYVSCNPATLARDLNILVHNKGYTLNKAGIIDMFPHTAHVESIAVLNKKLA